MEELTKVCWCLRILLWSLKWDLNTVLSTSILFYENSRSIRDQIRRLGIVRAVFIFFIRKPLTTSELCRHIVMVQHPVSVLPYLRPFAPHPRKTSCWQSDQVELTSYAKCHESKKKMILVILFQTWCTLAMERMMCHPLQRLLLGRLYGHNCISMIYY